MAPFTILVIGGGVTGIASAIALSKAFPPSELQITVFELRREPGNIGGAVNLTPNALRCLDLLDVLEELKVKKLGCDVGSIQLFSLHTGSSIGTIDYNGEGTGFRGYRGKRIMRSDLMQAMLAVAETMHIRIEYGKKVIGFEETPQSVIVSFDDGTATTGDLVLGCDGIHSAIRTQIEPDRKPRYSGISSAYGFVEAKGQMFFNDTALAMSRSGAILTTYYDDKREKIFLAALMESKAEISKDGWKARGEDKEAIRQNILQRFENSALPNMRDLVRNANEWCLYPVYLLPPGGKWFTERVMLLGDSAHAVSGSFFSLTMLTFQMPPKGESIGFALEDSVIFSHVLSHFGLGRFSESLAFYEKSRRNTINDAYESASVGWDTNKDKGFLFTKLMEWLTPIYLWWTKSSREASFSSDPRDIQFDVKE